MTEFGVEGLESAKRLERLSVVVEEPSLTDWGLFLRGTPWALLPLRTFSSDWRPVSVTELRELDLEWLESRRSVDFDFLSRS